MSVVCLYVLFSGVGYLLMVFIGVGVSLIIQHDNSA